VARARPRGQDHGAGRAAAGPFGLARHHVLHRQQFPPEYSGNIFAAEPRLVRNRSKRTGYKVIRVIMKDGVPTGEYRGFRHRLRRQRFDGGGRPVGVAVAKDGALLMSGTPTL
jgi:glucose/arabinose dehydrogenase